MIVLWIVSGVVLVAVVWVLFIPVLIRFSTTQHLYRLRMYPLEVCFLTDPWRIVVRVWGWERVFPILPRSSVKSAQPVQSSKRRKPFPYRKTQALLRSFHVQRFFLTLDTDDFAWNGPLFPALWWLSRWAGPAYRFEVNFQGRWALECEMENRVVRMLAALWR
jgi:hypothetical protein